MESQESAAWTRLRGTRWIPPTLTIPQWTTSQTQDHHLRDTPLQLEVDAGVIVDTDSDGFESDDEVKSVISQLDSSVRQLAGYEPIHVTSEAVQETDRHWIGNSSQESKPGDTVDSGTLTIPQWTSRAATGPLPRRSKRWPGRAGGRDNMN